MKDKSLSELSKEIEGGEYFSNAFNWYCNKYLKVYQERNIFFILFALLLICSVMIFFQIRAWYPLRVHRPVVIETSIDSDLYLTMNKMSDKYKNPDYAILSYLLKNFVKLMEEYKKGDLDALKIDNRMRKISNNATKEIARSFSENLYGDVENNPAQRFGNSGARRVEFKSITLMGIDESFFNQIKNFGKKVFTMPNQAVIEFTTTEKNFIGVEKKESWRVKLNFLFSGVLLDDVDGKREISIPQFTITNYFLEKTR